MKITTILKGGLGNQMFQYATARALAEKFKKYNPEVCINTGFYNNPNRKYPYPLSIDNYRISIAATHSTPYRVYKEPHYEYNDIFEKLDPKGVDMLIDGYWQCEKYFDNIRTILLQEFIPKDISQRLVGYVYKLCQHPNPYVVAVHIRRKEREEEGSARDVHGLVPWSYYEEAINKLKELVNNEPILFVIFTDDIDHAMSRYQAFPGKIIYIDPGPDYEDLYLMSKCNYAIIANSSFSWWGAWLIKNKDKIVISPDSWVKKQGIITKDVVPEKWIKLYTKLL